VQFLYHPDAEAQQITLDGDSYRYIFKVRRHRAGDTIALRNLSDEIVHFYTIENIDKKTAQLQKSDSKPLSVAPDRYLHIGWCTIDPKKIEKTLPSLNEIGVSKITFIHCERSQKNFKPDTDRLSSILLNSSQQCGRSKIMEVDFENSLEEFVSKYPEAYMLNFSDTKLNPQMNIEIIIIGCEGGFTDTETTLLSPEKTIGFNTHMTLRSENAAVAAASQILLS
jgi:16S rRNA (uracil1498-N3)-methyltransferase